MGATVETIDVDTDLHPHTFGAVTRWSVMYPSQTVCLRPHISAVLCVCGHFLSGAREARPSFHLPFSHALHTHTTIFDVSQFTP